jgi:two-component sensor histidine kinase
VFRSLRPLRRGCYFRDISAQVRPRQQRELLINELNHRVKNMLATAQSIAAQTLKGAAVSAVVKDALESRLLSLAGAHDVFARDVCSQMASESPDRYLINMSKAKRTGRYFSTIFETTSFLQQ